MLQILLIIVNYSKLYQIAEIEGEMKDEIWFYADQENLIFSLNLEKKKTGEPFQYEIVAQNFNHPIQPKKDKSKLRSTFQSIFGKFAYHIYLIPLKDLINLSFAKDDVYEILIEPNGKFFDIKRGKVIAKMTDYLVARVERALDVPKPKKVRFVKSKLE